MLEKHRQQIVATCGLSLMTMGHRGILFSFQRVTEFHRQKQLRRLGLRLLLVGSELEPK